MSQADARWSKIILINMPIYMYIYNLLKFTQKATCVTVEKYKATVVLARQFGLFGKFSIGRFSF